LLRFIVVSVLVFGGAVAWRVYGFLNRWPIGGLVVLSLVVAILGVGAAIQIWVFVRLKAQHASELHDERG
jgi:hypothetical protein